MPVLVQKFLTRNFFFCIRSNYSNRAVIRINQTKYSYMKIFITKIKQITVYYTVKHISLTSEENNKYLPINLGGDKKSLLGIGTFLVMYSQTTSMLYFN